MAEHFTQRCIGEEAGLLFPDIHAHHRGRTGIGQGVRQCDVRLFADGDGRQGAEVHLPLAAGNHRRQARYDYHQQRENH